jgi:hypothetical protein
LTAQDYPPGANWKSKHKSRKSKQKNKKIKTPKSKQKKFVFGLSTRNLKNLGKPNKNPELQTKKSIIFYLDSRVFCLDFHIFLFRFPGFVKKKQKKFLFGFPGFLFRFPGFLFGFPRHPLS